MAKFKVKFKISNLELEIEGEREAVGEMGQALKEQMSSLLMPPLVAPEPDTFEVPATPRTIDAKPSLKRNRKKTNPSTTPSDGTSLPDFHHDPLKFGNPVQEWKPFEKAMWTIYVVSKQTESDKLSPSEVAGIFNTHFGKSGNLRPSNVSRDLGKKRSENPPQVSFDAKQEKYGLFDSGEKAVEKLIASTRAAEV